MITFSVNGSWDKTEDFLKRAQNMDFASRLDVYAQKGVEALSASTPKKTGFTASSWYYEISRSSNSIEITWLNSNIQNGVNIALILQYGHGTGWGGYVNGVDYINPALKPVFDEILDNVWKEVTR